MTTQEAVAAPRPWTPASPASSRYPALPGAVEDFARLLSVIASRPVRAADVAVTQAHRVGLEDEDTHWFGTASGVAVGVPAVGGSVLAELILGLDPDPFSRPLSPVQDRILEGELLPLLDEITDAISEPGFPAISSAGTRGNDTLATLSATGVLTVATITLSAPRSGTAYTTGSGTVTCEVVLAAPTTVPSRRPVVLIDDLDPVTGDIPLTLQVISPPTRVPAGRLAALTPGSSLMLEADADMWLVSVGSVHLACGRLGTIRNRRSVNIDMTWRQNPMSDQILSGLAAAQKAIDESATEPVADSDLGSLGGVGLNVAISLGETEMPLRDVVAMHPGLVLELDREVDAPCIVLVNGLPYAKGETIVVGGRVGVRITEVLKGK